MNLDRLFERLRGNHDHIVAESRKALERTEQIERMVARQEPEVQRHNEFRKRTIADNHLAPKIRRAILEKR